MVTKVMRRLVPAGLEFGAEERSMLPIIYSTAVVLVLVFAVAVGALFVYHRPNAAVGLNLVKGITFHPFFLILYAAGFVVTYLFTARGALRL